MGRRRALHLDMLPPQARAALGLVPIAQASFRCPRCDRVSYNPTDIGEGYYGACNDWTARR